MRKALFKGGTYKTNGKLMSGGSAGTVVMHVRHQMLALKQLSKLQVRRLLRNEGSSEIT